jgi:hypothetical protein
MTLNDVQLDSPALVNRSGGVMVLLLGAIFGGCPGGRPPSPGADRPDAAGGGGAEASVPDGPPPGAAVVDAPAEVLGGAVAPWVVFAAVGPKLPLASSAVANPGFEAGPTGQADGWSRFGEGYEVDPTGGRAGTRGLRLASARAAGVHGASATIALAQTQPRPIYVSGWSRAAAVTGSEDAGYSLYLDLRHTDGTWSYGHTVHFAVGTHDWERRDRVIVPSKPVDRISLHCLFRQTHTGTVWFDDIIVRDGADTTLFDGQLVTPAPAAAPGARLARVASADGLALELGAGGAVTGLSLAGTEVHDLDRGRLGGLFVRDVRAQSDWIHPGGTLVAQGGVVTHEGEVPDLALAVRASYIGGADRIDVHAEVTDGRGQDRAVTLYFALPLRPGGWRWWDDLRRSRAIEGTTELATLSREWDVGAIGALNQYPWAVVSGPAGGLTLAHGLTEPRVARFVANPATRQLYVAFDLALSPETRSFPGRAWVDFTLYRSDGAWGFRAATQGYHDRFPGQFVRRLPPEREGIWLPFTSPAAIPGVADFGVGIHHTHDLAHVAIDEANGIAAFRYQNVPDTELLAIDGPLPDPDDPAFYDRVMEYLRQRHLAGTAAQRRQAEAILSSAFFDGDGRYRFTWHPRGEIPWCGGRTGCAMFPTSADPAIAEAAFPLNKARRDWDDEARARYTQLPGLDGEFIDGVQAASVRMLLDRRRSHWAVTRQPLTFAQQGRAIGVPSLFATVAFLQWLEPQLHRERNRLLMGNTMLEGLPWGANVFDCLGVEANWIKAGRLVPESDAVLGYRRALAGRRPFVMLQNTDFMAIALDDQVERYFQIALFHGIYPSFFSPDAANAPYWENPAFYQRDRPMFMKYIPLIRRLNVAGWEPVTLARASDETIHLERFGRWPDLSFTVRNTEDQAAVATITFESALGLPAGRLVGKALIDASRAALPIPPGTARTMTLALPPQGVEAVRLSAE